MKCRTSARVIPGSRSFASIGALVILVSSWPALLAQEDGCFGFPEPLGTLSLDGGTNNLGGASLTADGLTLYYDAWQGEAATGSNWIMVATRDDVSEPFDGGVRLGLAVNLNPAAYRSWGPRISADGRRLYFTTRGRSSSTWDIWVATKSDPEDPEAAFDRAQAVPDVNIDVEGNGADLPGCESPDGKEFFFMRQGNLWTARFVEPHEPLAGFTDVRELKHLNTAETIFPPTISPDGRYLVWSDSADWWGVDNRPGGHGGPDLWMAVRSSADPSAPFGPAINLPAPPNSGGTEHYPWLWSDGEGTVFLLFTDDMRPKAVRTGCFGADLATRARFTVSQGPGERAVLDATASTPRDAIVSYAWLLGDGTAAEGPELVLEGPGRHQATLRVETRGGTCDYHSEAVDVRCASGDVAPWVAADVGEPLYPGAARLLEPGAAGESAGLALCAGPYAIAAQTDGWFFVHQEAGGDFRLTARVSELVGALSSSAIALMAHASLAADAPSARTILYLRTDGKLNVRFQYRPGEGASLRTVSSGALIDRPLAWLRLERRGKAFIGQYSLDGESWPELGRQDLEGLPPSLQVGVAAAHRWSTLAPAPSAFEALQVRVSPIELESLVPTFRRGDSNGDGALDLSDAVFLFGTLFLGSALPGCEDAADADDSGRLDITDGIYHLNWLFRGGPAPAAPHGACGPDPTEGDSLGCGEYAVCEL
ncbi:MAG: PD40 domain-containing protein [Planctomycetes bacterium]|nr:PD40 domain-containing protein [Planctomycetota bacterium]